MIYFSITNNKDIFQPSSGKIETLFISSTFLLPYDLFSEFWSFVWEIRLQWVQIYFLICQFDLQIYLGPQYSLLKFVIYQVSTDDINK